MNKLEMKHLINYLPYELKILDFIRGGNSILDDTYILKNNNIHRCLTFMNKTEKPILRPLKDIDNDEFKDIKITNQSVLFKLHFDVYNLIEKGLAIDINTLL